MQAAEKFLQQQQWQVLCNKSDLIPNAGVCALVDGEQVAVFYLPDEEEKVFAVGNHDPFSKANVVYRGIVGDIQGRLVVASPVYKQHFDLLTGNCLEDEEQSLKVYSVALDGEQVKIAGQILS